MTAGPSECHWVYAGLVEEFGSLRQLSRTIEDVDLLLVRYGTEVFALQNRCSHLGQPLFGSRMMGGQIICAFHGACFEIRTGAAISGPAVSPVRTYPVHIDDGKIFVSLEKHTAA
jgi:3-phenylpropionate/trans-cinnamate dioxygenase ferredoxin subunit